MDPFNVEILKNVNGVLGSFPEHNEVYEIVMELPDHKKLTIKQVNNKVIIDIESNYIVDVSVRFNRVTLK